MSNIIGWTVKIVTICTTGLLVAQILFNFITAFTINNLVQALYTGIPCIALILIEFNCLEAFTKYFGFLAPLIGRGIFMALVGLTYYHFSFPEVLWSIAFWVCAAIYLTCGILTSFGKDKAVREDAKPDSQAYLGS